MNTTATTILWADVIRLKKMANAARAPHPNRTHARQLDAMAQHRFGVRHFHEFLQLYKAHVGSHVELDGAHHCRFCHITFLDEDAGDQKLHRERHQRFEEAQLALRCLPLPVRAREVMKRDFGYKLLYRGDAASRRMGALAIILSHYEYLLRIKNACPHASSLAGTPLSDVRTSAALPTASRHAGGGVALITIFQVLVRELAVQL